MTDSVEQWREKLRSLATRPPAGWTPRLDRLPVGIDACPPFVHVSGLCAIVSVDFAPAGAFLHLSVSMRDRLPRWPEVVRARDAFLGEHVACVHAVPDTRDHRNLHPYCLHLWARADGVPILDPFLGEYVAPVRP